MVEKSKAVQVQQKVKVGGSMMPALPYNTTEEVYYDIDKNIMLKDKLLSIDTTNKNIQSNITTIKDKLTQIETNLSDIETSIGDGGNLSQRLDTIKTELGNVTNSLADADNQIVLNNEKMDTIEPLIEEHENLMINTENGVHGVRFNLNELSYKDKDSRLWVPIQTAKNDIDLIKHALSGKISTNQFVLKKANCKIDSGCYRNGFYFINKPSYIDTTPQYRIMTVKIDLSNKDPETAVSYHDDAKNMIPGSILWDEFFGHYPCLLKAGVENGELQKNDFGKFLDGSLADITTGNAGDLMIAFPLRGLRMSVENNIMTISMTDNPNDPSFSYLAHTRAGIIKNVFYWGAYKGVVLNNQLRSLSGHTPSGSISLNTARLRAQANGSGYEISTFYPLNYLISAYLLKYKSRDSQTKVGMGYTKTNYSALKTGGTETKGMDWGETTGKQHMKVLGIEDFWGNIRESIDGLTITDQGNVLTSTGPFGETTEGYTNHGKYFSSNGSGIISKFIGTTELGFVPSEFSGTISSHFCDQGYASMGYTPFYGGGWNDDKNAGAFMIGIGNSPTFAVSNTGARLTYI